MEQKTAPPVLSNLPVFGEVSKEFQDSEHEAVGVSSGNRKSHNPHELPLSLRQQQVAQMKDEGVSARNIAKALGISERAVYTHLDRARYKGLDDSSGSRQLSDREYQIVQLEKRESLLQI